MINFIELRFKNFISYGNTETVIKLDFTDPTLILGQNLDDSYEGQIDSNGAGKSVIINAICYALYDKTMDGKEKDSLVNNINKKNLEVSLIFKKDNAYYKIERYRKNKAKGGTGVRLFESESADFAESKDVIKAGETNSQIEAILNMPFSIFSRVILFNAEDEPFLTLKAEHQKSIIENLCAMEEIGNKAKLLKPAMDEAKKELDIKLAISQQVEIQKKQIKDQIESIHLTIGNWDKQQKAKIEDLTFQSEQLKKIDFDTQKNVYEEMNTYVARMTQDKFVLSEAEKQLRGLKHQILESDNWNKSYKENLNNLEEEIKSNETIDFKFQEDKLTTISNITANLKLYESEEKNLEKNIDEYTSTIKKLDAEIQSLSNHTCPYCHQHYENYKAKLEKITNDRSNSQKELDEVVDLKSKLSSKIDKMSINLVSEKSELIFSSLSELEAKKISSERTKFRHAAMIEKNAEYEQAYKSIQNALEECTVSIDQHQDKIKAATAKIQELSNLLLFHTEYELTKAEQQKVHIDEDLCSLKEEINPHLQTLKKLESVQYDDTVYDKIDELQKTILHQEFLYKLLTKKDSLLRKILLQRSLPFLNGKLKEYLDYMSLPHQVEFKEDMSVSIKKFNVDMHYKELSNGQRARINLALAFAFRDLLQKRHGKVAFFMLDEALDYALGNAGIQQAAHMTKRIAEKENISLFIISHKDEISSLFSSHLMVKLENGFSFIDTEELAA